MRQKYTEDMIRRAVAQSNSYVDVAKNLGCGLHGGSLSHLRKRIKLEGIDTSHFKREAWNKGVPSNNKKDPSEVLIVLAEGSHRTKAYLLRRALQEVGREYICNCGVTGIWNGKPITLEVDHINGNPLDNREDNLRFICLNCHSQTPTYKNKARALSGMDEDTSLNLAAPEMGS